MAITIMGGLFVATLLTLLFLPSLYALWYRKGLKEYRSNANALHDKSAPSILVPIAAEAERR